MSRCSIRNVLLLTIDAFKPTFLRVGGNPLNVCPTINFLAENGILCTNARTHGFPTQMAFPSIMSGTLPLDHGGYDHGVINRPATLPELLKEAGLKTIGFSSSPWMSRDFGYARGYDEFHELFDVDKHWRIFSMTYGKYYAGLRSKGIIDDGEYIELAGKWFKIIISELQRLCSEKQEEMDRGRYPYRPELHRHDFSALERSLSQILSEFESDPGILINLQKKGRLENGLSMFLDGKPPGSSLRTWLIKRLDQFFRLFLIQMWRDKYSAPASFYADRIISTIDDNERNSFFIWTHFLDIHDNTYTKGPIGLPPDWLTLVPARLLTRNHPAKRNRTFGLRFVDRQISRIVNKLKSAGLLEQTLIVICGDHGYPVSSPEKIPGNLFDETMRVPLILYNPVLGQREIRQPCGLYDLAPTVLDIMGIEHRSEFTGASILRETPHDRPLILENLGPGPADFLFKAVRMAVIRGKYKLIWREEGYEDTSAPGGKYLFDLEKDPEERTNLYWSPDYSEVVQELEVIAHKRSAELRELNTGMDRSPSTGS